MASYTDQSTDSLLPGEPWTSAKALACFENPVAIAEGAAGAPRISTAAYAANSVNENAMKVQQFTATGTLGGNATTIITIPGNLVFFPRVSGGTVGGNPIEGVMAGGQLKLFNPESASADYTVSWYRIVP